LLDFRRKLSVIVSDSTPVLIVGAGPAGATAARELAASGVPVRLLDRAPFPRNKPCGGGISARVLSRFPYLRNELPRIATHTLRRLYLQGPDGESTILETGEAAALMIRRVEFDALLVSLAVRAGAELVSGADIVQASEDDEGVRLACRDGRRFAAPIVIAADGVNSVVARRLGLNPGWPANSVAIDMMEETPRAQLRDIDPSTLWVAYGYVPNGSAGKSTPEGYAYIFPKLDHTNIGIGYVLSYFREHIHGLPYDLQRGFVAELRQRGIVAGESSRTHFTPALIPIGGPLRRTGRGRVLLAGDAGGFVNAFTAEGIYYAMVTGEHAARAIVAGRDPAGERLARRYARACDREIGAELRDSVLIQQYLFADRRRMSRVVGSLPKHRAEAELILDYIRGTRSYKSVRRRVIGGSPRLAVSMVVELVKSAIR
jgi:geranylgeranyl reductase family protein